MLSCIRCSNHSFVCRISIIIQNQKNTKYDSLYNIFAIMFQDKAKSCQPDSDYYFVYNFFHQLFRGTIPDTKQLSSRCIVIILLLLHNLGGKVSSMDVEQINTVLQSEDADHQDSPGCTKVMGQLNNLYKFQSLSEFLNPLKVTRSESKKMFDLFSKQ